MAPSTVAGRLLARSLSHGGIAGAVVGSVLGALLVFILVLPFILRAVRDRRYHKKIAAENAEMGITGPRFLGGSGQAYGPPFSQPGPSVAGSGADGPAHGSADPAATLGDNNSSEDGKPFAAPSSSPSAAGAPNSAAAADAAPAIAPGVVAPPRAALPMGITSINTNIPPFTSGPRSASSAPQQPDSPPPALNSAATFPTLSSQDPMLAPRQRSSTMHAARSSSISHTLEGIAGRAAAIFHQGGTRSTPSRSPTGRSSRAPTELSRSPVEIGFDRFDSINHHTWLMRQQGIEDHSIGVDPTFFEVNTQYLTGASAEYYSGAPLSPPTDPNSSFMSPVSYAPTPPSRIATSLASMASAAAVTGVASSPMKQTKPTVSRTDSLRTTTTATDFSPLPLSPTSPLPIVPEGLDFGHGDSAIVPRDERPDEPSERGISSPPTGSVSGKTELTPEPVEFMPRSPSYRPLVPSPRLPAPGTVNPRDVWAPATDDERFVHKTAELDRIEQSPPPASSSEPGPSVVADVSPSAAPSPSDYSAGGEAEEGEASGTAGTSTQPILPVEPSPEEHLSPSSVPALADTSIATSTEPDATPADNVVDQFTPRTADDEAGVIKQAHEIDAGAGQTDSDDFDDLMLGVDYQGGFNFAYGESQQMGYLPDINGINNGVNDMSAFPLNGNTEANNVALMPQQNDAMYWSMPNNVPTIAGPFMTPVSQGDYSAGMLLAAPYLAPTNGSNGTNDVNDIHGVNPSSGAMPSQFSLHTPQSSPGQPPINRASGTIPLPSGITMPMTPSPPKLAPNFNSPLSVPSSGMPSRPVSPSSHQGSTPGQASSTSPRTFACDDCGRVFDQIHKLNHHKRYHERPHECTVPDCGKRFGTRTHLDRHVNDKHSKSRKYHCTEEGCPYSVPGGKSFPRKDNWRRHMVNKHNVHPDHDPIEVIDEPMAYA